MIVPPSQAVLHQSTMKSWFKSRHAKKVKMNYLKTKKEIDDDQVVINTFRLIDKDNSNTLDIEEIYTMFKKNGYNINMHLLKKFFDLADKDHNKFIELDEFRYVVYDEQACQCFRDMMRRMRQTGDENYYSTDFVKLLRYLSYCQSRHDLTFQISNKRVPVERRSKLVTSLLKNNEQFTDLDNDPPSISSTRYSKPMFQRKADNRHLEPLPKTYSLNSQFSTKTHLSVNSSHMISQKTHLKKLIEVNSCQERVTLISFKARINYDYIMEQLQNYIQKFPELDQGEEPPFPISMETSKQWIYSIKQQFRIYQFTILQTAFYNNTLVCLPTGLGKTFISTMLILNYSRWFPNAKIFFLAPTRPLVQQQQMAMKENGIEGYLTAKDRTYQQQIYFTTPQTFENDLNKDIINNIILVVFDEAHRAVGDYSYTKVVQKLPHYTRIVGLSATPGNNLEQIQDVIVNLRISKLELRDENDPEVKPYIKFKLIEKVIVSFSNCLQLEEIHQKMQPLLNIILGYEILPVQLIRVCSKAEVFSFGSCFKLKEFLNSQELSMQLGLQHSALIYDSLQQLHKLSYAKKVLIEQGLAPYAKYMGIEEIIEIHPKVFKLKSILQDHFNKSQSKVIIFTNSRDNAQSLCNHINEIEKVQASIFVGQANSKTTTGMRQKEQLEVLEKFKTNINVLVATCIAEEGLDIGEVDLIICYDSGFSPIRMIQRMGRTGRKKEGKIIVLLTEGKETADYEKSINKYSKLIKELKQSELNYYSTNPRVLDYQPILKIIDGNINDIKIEISQNIGQKNTKLIQKRKSKICQKQVKQISQNIRPLENYFKIVKVHQQIIEQNHAQQQSVIKQNLSEIENNCQDTVGIHEEIEDEENQKYKNKQQFTLLNDSFIDLSDLDLDLSVIQ